MSLKSENLTELKRIMAPWKAQAGFSAIRAGQAVILAGLRRRCPSGATGRLKRSIHATRIKAGKKSMGGAVVVTSGYAYAVEFGPHPRPFVMITKAIDGPKAELAMADELKRQARK